MKKFIEIYKINRRISHLNREMIDRSAYSPAMISGHVYSPATSPTFHRSDEKSSIIREAINQLIDERELVRNS